MRDEEQEGSTALAPCLSALTAQPKPGSVVQRRRHLRDMQETMVQLHPGSLE